MPCAEATLEHLLPVVLFFLYAEIHFRIPFVPSRLFRRAPEIILDVPHRLEPGASLPVLLIIKDAHRYPVTLQRLAITLSAPGREAAHQVLTLNDETIDAPLWQRIFTITPPPQWQGAVEVDCHLLGRMNGKTLEVRNDNYPHTAHRPFTVYLDAAPLPGAQACFYGDLHYHSDLTSDQVEFGAGPEMAARMAQALGLDFFAVTDHSYDLDDCWENYLLNDPDLPKWRHLQEVVQTWNTRHATPKMIAGEEVSTGNHKGHNVHILILNHRTWLPGSGDSAEKWLRTRPQLSIAQILDRLEPEALAFAAHAATRPPFLERLLFRRDTWHEQDLRDDRLTGMQIWNGMDDADFERGRSQWIKLLLENKRRVLIGGNDAHGNFGRSRQIAWPFLTMREKETQLFGQVRTGVLKTGEKTTTEEILRALGAGRCLVSSGPYGELILQEADGTHCRPGDATACKVLTMRVGAESSAAFGPLHAVEVYIGDHRTKKETRLSLLEGESGPVKFDLPLSAVPASGYIRLEVSSSRPGRLFRCLTNPVFLQPCC